MSKQRAAAVAVAVAAIGGGLLVARARGWIFATPAPADHPPPTFVPPVVVEGPGEGASRTVGPAAAPPATGKGPIAEWPSYGDDPGGTRSAPLDEITRDNVKDLEVAWTYRTGDMADPKRTENQVAFEATPLMVDGTLFVSTPMNRVVALDAETGAAKWTFDPRIDLKVVYTKGLITRGVSQWLDPTAAPDAPCRRRIVEATNDARLFALDARTGRPCAGFGTDGVVLLAPGMGVHNDGPGEYQVTSPPAIVKDLIVVGTAIADSLGVEAPSGAVRAFDARTGQVRWTWEALPRDAKGNFTAKPATTRVKGTVHPVGTPNVWAIMSADEQRDLVFLPTGNPSPDYFGGQREGIDFYGSAVVALRASTGEVVWSFQTVHHDLWNYDVAGEPVLATVKKDGRDVPVVLVSTKIGHLFVLDRETGKPVFPVEERPVPQGAVPDDHPSPTQPFPTHPPPLASQSFSANDVWGITEADKEGCKRTLAKLRNDGVFTPPTVQGTLLVPGSIGGMNWSGVTFDAARGLVVVNMNDLPQIVTLVPRDQFHPPDPDAPVPPGTPPQMPLEFGPQWGTPYAETHRWFLNGFSPCTPPPFGTLRAIDLASGTTKWEVPLGTMPEFKSAPGSEHWGSFNLGGNIVTRAGLVFVAASRDDMFRAFDEDTGKVLWEAHLPAGGQAAPMTYRARPGGKQYVVIAAGGHVALRSTPGDYVVAYALP